MLALSIMLIILGFLFVIVAIIGFAISYDNRGIKGGTIIFGIIAMAMILSGAILSDVMQLEECHCQNEVEEEK